MWMDVREHVGAAFFGVQNLLLTRLPQLAKLKKSNSDFQFVAQKVFILFVFFMGGGVVSSVKNVDFNILQRVEFIFSCKSSSKPNSRDLR